MRIVGQAGALSGIGEADINENFLTCVSSSVCYTLGSVGGDHADIARSVNGGATWTAGAPFLYSDNGGLSWTAASSPTAAAETHRRGPCSLTCTTGYDRTPPAC